MTQQRFGDAYVEAPRKPPALLPQRTNHVRPRLPLVPAPRSSQLEVDIAKAGIDLKLARNSLLPSLEVGVQAVQALTETTPRDHRAH